MEEGPFKWWPKYVKSMISCTNVTFDDFRGDEMAWYKTSSHFLGIGIESTLSVEHCQYHKT